MMSEEGKWLGTRLQLVVFDGWAGLGKLGMVARMDEKATNLWGLVDGNDGNFGGGRNSGV